MSFVPHFMDHPSVSANPDAYANATLDLAKAMPSWKQSLVAHKWLDEHGTPRKPDNLGEDQQTHYADIIRIITAGHALPKPIVGLGMFDNVEIGSGAGIVAILASMGVPLVPVHIRRAQEKGLRKFLV